MKKILFVAAAATLLAAGCQKTEVINPVSPTGEPAMSFSTGMNKLTKASGDEPDAAVVDGNTNLQAQDFQVWAYCAYDDPNTTDDETNTVYDEIEGLPVTYSSVNENWGTEKQYFWPGQGKELQFFAVSTYKNNGTITPTTGENPSLKVENFQVDPDDPNTDLMVADFVKQHQGDKDVNLLFHHALSKVEFVFKTNVTDGITVYVQSLEVGTETEGTVTGGLTTNGTLNVTPVTPSTGEGGNTETPSTGEGENTETSGTGEENENTTDENIYSGAQTSVQFAWVNASTPASAVFTDDYTTEATDMTADDDPDLDLLDEDVYDKTAMKLTANPQPFTTWLMVPQSVADKKVTVTYMINKRQFQSVFPLKHSNLTDNKWDCNQYIKYTINLSPNLISFTPTVKPWDDPTDVTDQN